MISPRLNSPAGYEIMPRISELKLFSLPLRKMVPIIIEKLGEKKQIEHELFLLKNP